MSTFHVLDGLAPVSTNAPIRVMEDGKELGTLHPARGGICIKSPNIINRMGLTYIDTTENVSTLCVNLTLPLPTGMGMERLVRSVHFEEVVANAVQYTTGKIWSDRELTMAEQRLAWALVIEKMYQSLMLDITSMMLRERVGG